ncbi:MULTISPECIES: shikimate dehydrogenase [Thermomonospora]|uniref:Shikimate dehydrogenase substrate binding domain protein n=1 Tax=Thermomonospora curvata (strain ATCC 19995 / DSM 43183 / JCM 3096 / KCTC 9072 / NBRC 15933 / NCIMB 10081 / Henssen B9) TaxID=471852 RepID=D1AEX9_THECD|nr:MULTISPECIES: shikimate dehydrogenase [Thermomonospora]ACY97704.1 Shikimate dehydrogenase substrate binding domain protein [Thermomonospora curvata DSM 43183]PKK14447.1 MAG: shikimate dehydrogenase [Thermomonospora sp. CIF 1]
MPRAAVLGSPIAHSLSPVLHRAAYAAMGLTDWTYEAIECDEAGLAPLLDRLGPEWAGLSLTMPLKRTALKLVDEASQLAETVGGVNTIVWRDGRRFGDNTDVYGIVTALTEAGVRAPRSAVVLGGGATAASTLAALSELGLRSATLAVRRVSRAAETRQVGLRLGLQVEVVTLDRLAEVLPADLVASTLPGRAADPYAELVAGCGAAVFDAVYAPWPTELAKAVQRAGGTVVGGFPMLLHQAVRQVQMMTGRRDVPVEAMRAAGEAELAARAG